MTKFSDRELFEPIYTLFFRGLPSLLSYVVCFIHYIYIYSFINPSKTSISISAGECYFSQYFLQIEGAHHDMDANILPGSMKITCFNLNFSASVRRTSMRDKSALSWKEAREEAKMMRGSAASEDEEEDNNGNSTKTGPQGGLQPSQPAVDAVSGGSGKEPAVSSPKTVVIHL